jgi:hypothetical protein
MMVLRIKPRSEFVSGDAVCVSDVADLYCDATRRRAQSLPVSIPREDGIWLVDAGSIVAAIYREYPGEKITVLGDTIGWISRRSDRIMRRGFFDKILAFIAGVMLSNSPVNTSKGTRYSNASKKDESNKEERL